VKKKNRIKVARFSKCVSGKCYLLCTRCPVKLFSPALCVWEEWEWPIKRISSSIRLSIHETRALIGCAARVCERWCASFLSFVTSLTTPQGKGAGRGGCWKVLFKKNSLLFFTKFHIRKSISNDTLNIWKFRETEQFVRKHYFYMDSCKAALKWSELLYK